MVNNTKISGNWSEQKEKLKKRYSDLTDNDLLFKDGSKEAMYRRLYTKLGITKDVLIKIIEEL